MKDITTVIIDTIEPDLAANVLDYNCSIFNTKSAKIFTNLNKLSYTNHDAHHVDINNINDYSNFIINDLVKYIETNFVFIIQRDGFIINPHLWDDKFLDYDYIGAPWPFGDLTTRVGNGGFCIRSKKFLELTSHFVNVNNEPEDHYLCRTNYNNLIDKGLKFADLQTACKFALEHRNPEYNQTYSSVFGVHGIMHKNILYDSMSKNSRFLNNKNYTK